MITTAFLWVMLILSSHTVFGTPGSTSRVTETVSTGQNHFVVGRELDLTDETIGISTEYTSRALEFVRFGSMINRMANVLYGKELDIRISYTYMPTLADRLCSLRRVFSDFNVEELLQSVTTPCPCQTAQWGQYRDPHTVTEYDDGITQTVTHVRTMDLGVVWNDRLRMEMQNGLFHVPLEPTTWKSVRIALTDVWEKLTTTLYGSAMTQAKQVFSTSGLKRLLEEAKTAYMTYCGESPNRVITGQSMWCDPGVLNCISQLAEVGFWSGIESASASPIWRCIRHERLQAYAKLAGSGFQPVVTTDQLWISEDEVVHSAAVMGWLWVNLAELTITHLRLPYLFSLYGEHEDERRYQVETQDCVYSDAAVIVRVATEAALEVLRIHAGRIDVAAGDGACSFPSITSMYEVLLNIPVTVHSVFSCKVGGASDNIPVTDVPDSLQTPVKWVFKMAFEYYSGTVLCIKWSLTTREVLLVSWDRVCPPSGGDYIYLTFNLERIIQLSIWLMTTAYVRLGDRVWLRILGICEGYDCSPIWCTLYYLFYEFHFIQRLRRLKHHAIEYFKEWHRYQNDILALNGTHLEFFMGPQRDRTEDNPYWIYPSNILSVTVVVEEWYPERVKYFPRIHGKRANFLCFTITSRSDSTYALQRYVKQNTLPFKSIQVMHFASNRPRRDVLAALLSQLLPLLYVHTDERSASDMVRNLVDYLITEKGYPCWNLKNKIRWSIQTGQYYGLMYDHTLIVV